MRAFVRGVDVLSGLGSKTRRKMDFEREGQ
jgi:hypothetical protein